ncbi:MULTISPECIES: Rieske (2Fe-2S) protein [unclassified Cupriavidus]|nr:MULTISPECIES: Rieske (2Fe-2S) protein [unclassified Cupriavidus]
MLCHLEDIADGQSLAIQTATEHLVLVRRGTQVWAYVNRCPHFSIPLDFVPGTIHTYEAEVLMCAHHSALFRFHDGVCIDGPCQGSALASRAVRVVQGKVFLQ